MKVKEVLQEVFYQEETREKDRIDIVMLEQKILQQISKPQMFHSLSLWKYLVIPSISITAVVLLLLQRNGSSIHQIGEQTIIQQVSAEGLLNAMQASINSERLHVIAQTQSNAPDTSNEADSMGNKEVTETWIDRKAHLSRIDRKDAQGRLRVLIIKEGVEGKEDKTYQFVIGGMHTFIPDARYGLWVSRTDHDGYENMLDLTLRGNYVQTLKDSGVQVDAHYEETTYQGKAAYKLTLNHPKDKAGVLMTETLLIDKSTQLPYQDVTTMTGRPDIQGTFTMTTIYTVSTQFSNDVFERKVPQDYTLLTNPKITHFEIPRAGEYNMNNSQETVWKSERELDAQISSGDKMIQTGDGFMPDGYMYKVFMSKENFDSEVAARDAKEVTFQELLPHNATVPFNNASSQVYILPNIPDKNFTKYGIFKLEVDDIKGKKLYDVIQVMQFKQFAPPFSDFPLSK